MEATIPPINYTLAPVLVTTGRALTDADHGRTLECPNTITLTVPETLMDGFQVLIDPTGGAAVTLDPQGSAQINDSTASIVVLSLGSLARRVAAARFAAGY